MDLFDAILTRRTVPPAKMGPPGPDEAQLRRILEAGEKVDAVFAVSNFTDLSAYQFALQFDPAVMQFDHIEILNSAIPLDPAGNFGLYNIGAGELRAVWTLPQGATTAAGTVLFKVVFQALESGQRLSDLLKLYPAVVPEIAYGTDLTTREVELEFVKEGVIATGTAEPGENQGVLLFQNRPNPFSGSTTISFVLPEAMEAELRVLDVTGRLLKSYRAEYSAGRHQVVFESEGAVASGLLYYELITKNGKIAKKMLATGK